MGGLSSSEAGESLLDYMGRFHAPPVIDYLSLDVDSPCPAYPKK